MFIDASAIVAILLQEAEARVAEFLATAGIETLDTTPNELPVALSAFDRYGSHRYPLPADHNHNKGLNPADCFHYATAKLQGLAILTTDDGFALTDLPTELAKPLR